MNISYDIILELHKDKFSFLKRKFKNIREDSSPYKFSLWQRTKSGVLVNYYIRRVTDYECPSASVLKKTYKLVKATVKELI